MPVITYDYSERPFKSNGKTITLYHPLLPIRLSGKHKMYSFYITCLVDSGADHNLIPADIGEYLGINITKGTPVKHLGIGGKVVTAYGQVKSRSFCNFLQVGFPLYLSMNITPFV